MLSSVINAIRNKGQNSSELQHLLERAKEFANQGNWKGLEDLQRLVLRAIQSRHMVDAYLKPDHKALGSLNEWTDLGLHFIPGIGKNFSSFLRDNRLDRELLPAAKLGRDIVLPTCWHPSSMIRVLGNIGNGRKLGPWKQDSNHLLHYWFPLNIYWVGGGNHSIVQGVVLAEGEVEATEGYDLSKLFLHVRFDGTHWIDNHSGAKIGLPRYQEFGYVYEIGRLLVSDKV